jgi:hypothetical protein
MPWRDGFPPAVLPVFGFVDRSVAYQFDNDYYYDKIAFMP